MITLSAAIAILAGTTFLARVLDTWMVESEKASLHQKLLELASEIEATDPLRVVQFPLQAMSFFYDAVFGNDLLSWRAFRRTATVTLLCLAIELGWAGWITGVYGGMEKPPWAAIDLNVQMADSVIEKIDKDQSDPAVRSDPKRVAANEQTRKWATTYRRIYAAMQSPPWRVVFTIGLISLIVGWLSFWGFLSFALSRRFIREMMSIDRKLLASSALIVHLELSTLIGIATLLFSGAAISPVFLVAAAVLAVSFFTVPVFGPASFSFFLWVAWKVQAWIRVVAATTMVPATLLVVVMICSLGLYPWRHGIQSGLLQGIRRGVGYKAGFLGFVAVNLGFLSVIAIAISAVLGAITKLLL